MADARIEGDLTLDARPAFRVVDDVVERLRRGTTDVRLSADTRALTASIDAAIQNADTSVRLTADSSSVTGAVDAAVANADTSVELTGDATEVTGSIDAAVENADTDVVVTADATDVSASITAAVESADTSVAVEGSVSPGLTQGVDNLGDSLDAAATSGISLGTILGGLSIAATIAGLRQLADAASDLQESTSKAQVVFGDGFSSIERFAEGAAQSTGLAAQEALEATATFGNLFQALGQSREEATRLSPEVVQLAADLASFNNIGVDEALEKLRSGLVGEVEPLRSLGVSFLAADVNAKALELGLGTLSGELTEGEKVQARLALITEQTSLAHGDFARTADGLANSQRTLRAELGNAAAAAGTQLLPAFEALVREGTDAIPGLLQLAENVLPALSSSLVTLAPLIGTSVDLLVALSPIVQLVATTVGLIPAPVIQAAGALLTLNRALRITQELAKAKMFTDLAGGIGGIIPPATAGVTTLQRLSIGAGGLTTTLKGLTTGMSGATLAAGAGFAAFSLYSDMMANAKAEGEEFGRSIREDVGDLGSKSVSELADLTRTLDSEIVRMSGDIDDSFLGRNGVNRDYNASLREGISQMEELRDEAIATQAALEQATAEAEFQPLIAQYVATGDALARLRDTAPAAASAIATVRQGGDASAGSFLDLALNIDAAELSAEQMADAAALLGTDVESLTAFVERSSAAMQDFVDTAVGALPTVSDAFGAASAAVSAQAGEQADALLERAKERADAISESAAASAQAVVDAAATGNDAAKSAAESRADSIRTNAQDQGDAILEAAQTQAESLREGGEVTASALIDSLNAAAEELSGFRLDLSTIADAGFAELAGTIAKQGPEVGGQLAAELATAIEGGNTEIVQGVQDSLDTFQSEWFGMTTFLRETLGPQFILETAFIGEQATATFGENVDFAERMRIAGALAQTELDQQGQAIALIAALEGDAAATEYGKALQLDEAVVREAVAAGRAIRENAPTDAARAAGEETGDAFGKGVIRGMERQELEAAFAAQGLVGAALIAARKMAGIRSPSTLFRDLVGIPIGQGIATGITATETDVNRATEGVVTSAAGVAIRSAAITVPRPAVLAPGGSPGVGSADLASLVDVLERAIREGSRGARVDQLGPFYGLDPRRIMGEAFTELDAFSRAGR